MSQMSRSIRERVYQGYRDAIGALLCAARGDQEGYAALRAYTPSLDSAAVDALIAISLGLMREIDARGGDSGELVARWAQNIARREHGDPR